MQCLKSDCTGIVQRHFSLFTFLGSHEDYAICTAGTINGSCRSIFQNVDSFNIRRIDVFDAAGLDNHTVNNIQRTLLRIDRTYTADIDTTDFTRALAGCDVHTGSFSLHSFQRILDRHRFQFFFAYASHSTGYVTLLLDAVTYYYNFIQHGIIFL